MKKNIHRPHPGFIVRTKDFFFLLNSRLDFTSELVPKKGIHQPYSGLYPRNTIPLERLYNELHTTDTWNHSTDRVILVQVKTEYLINSVERLKPTSKQPLSLVCLTKSYIFY